MVSTSDGQSVDDRAASPGADGSAIGGPGSVDVPNAGATVEELRDLNGHLQAALESRVVIEQAKGLLAERYELSVGEAFDLLRYSARSHRTRLHDLASAVVASKDTPAEILAALPKQERWRASNAGERHGGGQPRPKSEAAGGS